MKTTKIAPAIVACIERNQFENLPGKDQTNAIWGSCFDYQPFENVINGKTVENRIYDCWQRLRQFEKKWIETRNQLPEHGQLVVCYRNIESEQMFVTYWSDEDEKYYHLNEVTKWIALTPPTTH